MNNQQPPRQFNAAPAVRCSVPLLIGLMGPSGSGKTYSALRLASGMQKVVGGDIYVLDTEARRALHYADNFKFMHVAFGAPFSPDDYLAALRHCVSQGAKTIVIDSASLCHEGQGGVLEMHDEEVQRMGGQERHNFAAWAKPKASLRRLLNAMTQLEANLIFCFRAKERLKPKKGGAPEEMGFMPIAGDEFIYEMTMNALLLPASGGVPTWISNETGEKAMIKLPEQFRKELLNSKEPLSEATGEMLARWAAGTGAPPKGPVLFARQYAEYGGSPIVDAPPSVVDHYVETLLATLNDDAKRGLHSQVRAHLDRVLAAAKTAAS